MIGDTLVRDDLGMSNATKDWIAKRREYLERSAPKLDIKPLTEVMVLETAYELNRTQKKLPPNVIKQGTLLQYCIDTEIDKWLAQAMQYVLSGPLLINPFITIIVNAQQMCFKLIY